MLRRFLSARGLLLASAAFAVSVAERAAGDLFVGGQTGDVWRGDPTNGQFTYFTCACVGSINSLASEGSTLYLVDHFQNAWVIDIPMQTFTNAFVSIGNDGQGLAVDGPDLLAGGSNNTIVRIDRTTGQHKQTLTTQFPVSAMVLEGDHLIYGSPMGVAQKGHKNTGDFQFLGLCGGPINSMLKDGDKLYLGDVNGSIYVYSDQTQQVAYAFSVASDATAMAWDGGALLIGGTNGKIHRVNPANGQLLATLNSPVPVGALLMHNFCAADLNGDGRVDQADLALLLSAYNFSADGDVDGDGDTDQQDLSALLASYGSDCN